MTRFGTTLALAVSTAALMVVAPRAHATTVRPLGGSELVRGSSDIVVGTVVRQSARWDDKHRRIFTDVRVLVSERLKGAPADTLTLTELGGEVDGAHYEVPGGPRFQIGEEVLLFAWRDKQGHAQANGLAEGKCTITRDAGGARVVRGLPTSLVPHPRATMMRAGVAAPDATPAPLSDALGAIRAELAKK